MAVSKIFLKRYYEKEFKAKFEKQALFMNTG